MKTKGEKKHRRLKKRRHRDSGTTLFAIILAVISRNGNSEGEDAVLILRCLNRLHRSLPQTLSAPFLSLLPALLSSRSDEIACKSAEIVGALSLMSFEMNEKIASDGQIVKGLITLLRSSNSIRSIAACNSVLDLSTTSIGRKQLVDLFAIENLIVRCFQAPKSSASIVALLVDGKDTETCPGIVFKEDELSTLLVHAIIILVNSCTIEQLQKIPTMLSRRLLLHLKKLWEEVHKQMLYGNFGKCTEEGFSYLNNVRTNNLAESVFRLSVDINPCRGPSDVIEVGKRIFGAEGMSLERFMLRNWESSPVLVRSSEMASSKLENMFGSFIESGRLRESVCSFLSPMLRGLVCCPPISSEEHDILHFLKEVSNDLGGPILYQEDIRVVKTNNSEFELHYFRTQSGSGNSENRHVLSSTDILKCEEAYKEGYTIALRGMGFRFASIASVADDIASIFGQPSIGVNLYLTPPGCQGLARHSDDHCVFICQLLGAKKWNVFPSPSHQLPRLYESLETRHQLESERYTTDGCKEILLKEGDILYIPRGYPHSAHTIGDGSGHDATTGFSLHLTLAIEVEPPFEWEGFTHVALDHWYRRQRATQYTVAHSESLLLHNLSAILIHVAVKLVGDIDPTFRKACLVGAISSANEDWLLVNQTGIFSSLIGKINTESIFSDALKYVEAATQKHEDPFAHLKWLRHLSKGEHEPNSTGIHLADAKDIFHRVSQRRDAVEAVFYQVKSCFCSEVEFEDARRVYIALLGKYRKARNQYTNGMLSLHCIDN
nr:putative jmjC domain, Armadillo-type fold protein [Ipomoea batatas]